METPKQEKGFPDFSCYKSVVVDAMVGIDSKKSVSFEKTWKSDFLSSHCFLSNPLKMNKINGDMCHMKKK